VLLLPSKTTGKNRRALDNKCADGDGAGSYPKSVTIPNPNLEAVMPTIKIHLEQAEHDAITRFATLLNVKPEAVAYAALNRLMLEARTPALRVDIVETWEWHHQNLPLWSDSACSVHAYEGKADDEPSPSRYVG
jgi:hypothetical protein